MTTAASNLLRLLAPVALLLAPLAGVVAQSSGFTASAEGWIGVTLPFPAPGAPPVELGTPIQAPWFASGGNPGGCLRMVDPDGSQPVGHVQYWKAPAGQLGDRSACLGGTLRYDVRLQTALPNFAQEDVLLTGNGLTLAWFANVTPTPHVWTTFSVPLQAGPWRVGTRTGPVASAAQVATVLSSLSSMYLRGEFQNGVDTMLLDNVALAPAASVLSFGSACQGTAPQLQLTATSLPVLGASYDLLATPPATATLGLFVHATTPIPGGVDLTFLGMNGCSLYVDLEVMNTVAIVAGTFTQSVPVPNDLGLIGVHIYSQAAALAPLNAFGLVTSAALDATLAP